MFGKHKSKNQSLSFLGKLVDKPFDEFKKEIEEQHVNLGTIKNYILYLNSAYSDLASRKDELIKGFSDKPDKEKKAIHDSVNGIYLELTKIEQKVVYLKERAAELEKLPEGEIDTAFEK